MKSRFFTDTQGLDEPSFPPDKVSVCLLLNRCAYEHVLHQAGRLGITSGEYIDHLILADAISACGTKVLLPSDSPWRRTPPAPPDH